MRTIDIKKMPIAELDVDAIADLENEGLTAEGELSRADVNAAGAEKYIIHSAGLSCINEIREVYNVYYRLLELADGHGCRSIGMPLISSGASGCKEDEIWDSAFSACSQFFDQHPESPLDIIFAVADERSLRMGRELLLASDVVCYSITDPVQRAMCALNEELTRNTIDYADTSDTVHILWFTEVASPDETDIEKCIRSTDPFNMDDVSDCIASRRADQRIDPGILEEIRNAIIRIRKMFGAELYDLSTQGWEKYKKDAIEIWGRWATPLWLVRVHGEADHWYIFSYE